MSIDNQNINSFLPPPTALCRKNEKYILLSDGTTEHHIFIGGKFIHDFNEYTIKDINQDQINIDDKWYPKNDFEPADITIMKGRTKKRNRGSTR